MKRNLGLISLLITIMLLVNGLFPQLEMFLFHGEVKVSQVIFKVLLLVVLISSFLFSKYTFKEQKYILILWWTFTIYILVEIVILPTFYGYDLNYILLSFNSYYFFFLIFPIVFILRSSVEESNINKILIFFSITTCLMGLLQYFLKHPILYTESLDGNFKVYSWIFYDGTIRAFSFFDSGLSFGIFLAMIVGMLFTKYLRTKGFKKVSFLLCLILALLSVYTTLTRNIYLEVLGSLALTYLFLRSRNRNNLFIRYSPLFLGGISWIINNSSLILSSIFKSNIFDTTSLVMRQQSWASFRNLWLQNGIFTSMFGRGIIQSDKFFDGNPIDNTFLAVGLDIGWIGLILWIVMMWAIWKYVLRTTINNPTALNISITAFFSTWVMTSMFNLTLPYYLPAIFIMVISNGKSNPIEIKREKRFRRLVL
jgi:hypothetical protein